MHPKKWLQFLHTVIPDETSKKDLQQFFGTRLSGSAGMSRNIHGAFDQPCEDPGGFATKVVK